ncbi:SCO family protein [Methylobacterium sp. 092160098-2]|jgi:protein SCO1/2|uniref:SCO family protein n=1 Tax=Methylobacterium sp. 092160098-2 TaxID=3025129 RepID=UPI002381C8D1|nr:SCO family protein [Methylobacterium sp. 092160098-2]MDE4916003.1 SCO family protein [Methylobacterium sp. 092160098-2]
MTRRLLLVLIVALVPVVAVAAFYLSEMGRPTAPAVQAIGKPAIGGPFRLTTHDGQSLSSEDLKGKPFAVFFGFTHCPDICPTTLFELAEDLKALGPEAGRLQVLFVTVDPQRDTPELLSRYVQSFSSRIVGLTGSEEEVAAAVKAYKVFRQKLPTEGGDYTMNHTATVYLMDREGQFFSALSPQESQEMRRAKLKRLLREG